MKRFFSELNPTLRGFLIIALIAVVIVSLELYNTLAALLLIARIAFLIAIAVFVYLMWRDQRQNISMWSTRARYVFYGAALLIVADFLVWFVQGIPGRDAFAFVLVLVACAYAMWKTWRDEHTYT